MIFLVIISLFLCGISGNLTRVEISGLEKGINMRKRIVGGYYIQIRRFPWIVSIYTGNRHFCSGSILSKTTILTAAHCALEFPRDSLNIRVGSSRVDDGGSKHTLVNLKVHENYTVTADFVWNDVALIEVKPPINFRNTVRNVRLPKAASSIPPGTLVRVAGWGRTATDGEKSKSLMYTHVRIVDYAKCSREYEAVSDTFLNSHGLLCAAETGKDVCNGDSGGPLMIGSLQVGIVSFNRGVCASTDYPSIYTNVSFHSDWINKNIANNQSSNIIQQPSNECITWEYDFFDAMSNV